MVREFLKIGPRHDLKKVSINRRIRRIGWKAVRRNGGGTVRVKMIEIFTRPYDLNKVLERVIAFGQSSFSRRGQIA
jgi:hypothetical protein